MEIFNKNKALELVDRDESLLEILINAFLEQNKFEQSELDALYSENKMEEAAGYVHATKGAARQLCLEKLQQSGQELEDLLRGKKEGDYTPLRDKMLSDYNEAIIYLKSL